MLNQINNNLFWNTFFRNITSTRTIFIRFWIDNDKQSAWIDPIQCLWEYWPLTSCRRNAKNIEKEYNQERFVKVFRQVTNLNHLSNGKYITENLYFCYISPLVFYSLWLGINIGPFQIIFLKIDDIEAIEHFQNFVQDTEF